MSGLNNHVVTWGDVKFCIRWEDDEDSCPPWGEYDGKARGYYVDRDAGVLYGPQYVADSKIFVLDHSGVSYRYLDDDRIIVNAEDADWLAEGESERDVEAVDYHRNTTPPTVTITRFHKEVLARNIRTRYFYGEYRYYHPKQYLPFDENNWRGANQQEVEQCWRREQDNLGNHSISTGDLMNDLDILYVVEDCERQEAYGVRWNYTRCIVSARVNDVEIATESLSGIESDADDDYLRSIEQDLIDTLKTGLPAQAEKYREIARILSPAL
jgi:hypothetical protein